MMDAWDACFDRVPALWLDAIRAGWPAIGVADTPTLRPLFAFSKYAGAYIRKIKRVSSGME